MLDEPEAALTFYNQYVLMNMVAEAQKNESQLIISTHSPVLLAYPNACIYELKDGAIQKTSYEELENIRFLWAFMKDMPRYLKNLFSEQA